MILVTGVAGFIGNKVVEKLLENNMKVVGIDNLNNYYDIKLKQWRLERTKKNHQFKFYEIDIENVNSLKRVFNENNIKAVINLAARAGVRYSIENPFVYFSTNVVGNLNLLEMCKAYGIKKYVLASSSSVYGGQKIPFLENLPANNPISPYAASKKAAEITAYTYHYLYGIDVSILRYFTVYGPAGRPDMSPFRFIKWIIEGLPLIIYGDGNQERDFTYVDDIAEGTIKALQPLGFEIINLGNSVPYKLSKTINLMEKYIGKQAICKYKDFNSTDMKSTCADIRKAKNLLGWQPEISLEEGIKKTIDWMITNWDWVKDINI